MSLVWTVPVAGAAVALVLLLTQVRKLEDLSVGLVRDVRRLRDIRSPLARLRRELDSSAPLVDDIWAHWDREGQD